MTGTLEEMLFLPTTSSMQMDLIRYGWHCINSISALLVAQIKLFVLPLYPKIFQGQSYQPMKPSTKLLPESVLWSLSYETDQYYAKIA